MSVLVIDSTLQSVLNIQTGTTAMSTPFESTMAVPSTNVQDAIEYLASLITGTNTATGTAGASISALQVIRFDVSNQALIANANDFSQLEDAIGITTTSAAVGFSLNYITQGFLEDSGWSWSPGDSIFVDDTGGLANVPGTHIRKVAAAVSATRIFVDFEDPFFVNS